MAVNVYTVYLDTFSALVIAIIALLCTDNNVRTVTLLSVFLVYLGTF